MANGYFCKEHSEIKYRIEKMEDEMRSQKNDVENLKIKMAIMQLKLALIVSAASLIGGILANFILRWL